MKWKVKVGPEGIEKALDDELKKIVGAMRRSPSLPGAVAVALRFLLPSPSREPTASL